MTYDEINEKVREIADAFRAWYLRGPGARGATVIATEPLCITYDDFGRRNLAAITFVWSRAEFSSRSTNLLEPGV